jgi:hypothetical protein
MTCRHLMLQYTQNGASEMHIQRCTSTNADGKWWPSVRPNAPAGNFPNGKWPKGVADNYKEINIQRVKDNRMKMH